MNDASPPSRGRRRGRRALVALAVAVVIAGLLVLSLPSLAGTPAGRRMIASAIAERVGAPVSIDALDASWGGPQRVGGLRIDDGRGGDAVRADVVVHRSLLGLLGSGGGDLDVDLRGTVRLAMDGDGRVRLPGSSPVDASARSPAAGAGGATPPATLPTLRMRLDAVDLALDVADGPATRGLAGTWRAPRLAGTVALGDAGAQVALASPLEGPSLAGDTTIALDGPAWLAARPGPSTAQVILTLRAQDAEAPFDLHRLVLGASGDAARAITFELEARAAAGADEPPAPLRASATVPDLPARLGELAAADRTAWVTPVALDVEADAVPAGALAPLVTLAGIGDLIDVARDLGPVVTLRAGTGAGDDEVRLELDAERLQARGGVRLAADGGIDLSDAVVEATLDPVAIDAWRAAFGTRGSNDEGDTASVFVRATSPIRIDLDVRRARLVPAAAPDGGASTDERLAALARGAIDASLVASGGLRITDAGGNDGALAVDRAALLDVSVDATSADGLAGALVADLRLDLTDPAGASGAGGTPEPVSLTLGLRQTSLRAAPAGPRPVGNAVVAATLDEPLRRLLVARVVGARRADAETPTPPGDDERARALADALAGVVPGGRETQLRTSVELAVLADGWAVAGTADGGPHRASFTLVESARGIELRGAEARVALRPRDAGALLDVFAPEAGVRVPGPSALTATLAAPVSFPRTGAAEDAGPDGPLRLALALDPLVLAFEDVPEPLVVDGGRGGLVLGDDASATFAAVLRGASDPEGTATVGRIAADLSRAAGADAWTGTMGLEDVRPARVDRLRGIDAKAPRTLDALLGPGGARIVLAAGAAPRVELAFARLDGAATLGAASDPASDTESGARDPAPAPLVANADLRWTPEPSALSEHAVGLPEVRLRIERFGGALADGELDLRGSATIDRLRLLAEGGPALPLGGTSIELVARPGTPGLTLTLVDQRPAPPIEVGAGDGPRGNRALLVLRGLDEQPTATGTVRVPAMPVALADALLGSGDVLADLAGAVADVRLDLDALGPAGGRVDVGIGSAGVRLVTSITGDGTGWATDAARPTRASLRWRDDLRRGVLRTVHPVFGDVTAMQDFVVIDVVEPLAWRPAAPKDGAPAPAVLDGLAGAVRVTTGEGRFDVASPFLSLLSGFGVTGETAVAAIEPVVVRLNGPRVATDPFRMTIGPYAMATSATADLASRTMLVRTDVPLAGLTHTFRELEGIVDPITVPLVTRGPIGGELVTKVDESFNPARIAIDAAIRRGLGEATGDKETGKLIGDLLRGVLGGGR